MSKTTEATATTTTKPTVEAAEPTATVQTAPSKAQIARKIFSENWPAVQEGTMARKDVIALFKSEANLTQAGANTYYQLNRKNMIEGNFKL